MTENRQKLQLAGLAQLCRDNARRLEALEEQTAAIHSLATSVAVMAEKLNVTAGQVESLCADVREIRAEPANRWRGLVEKVIYFLVAAAMGYFTAALG